MQTGFWPIIICDRWWWDFATWSMWSESCHCCNLSDRKGKCRGAASRISCDQFACLSMSRAYWWFHLSYLSLMFHIFPLAYLDIFGICWNDEATWLWLCAGWLNNRLHSSPCKLESLARHLGVCEIVLCKMLKKAIPNLQNDSSIVIKSGKWM